MVEMTRKQAEALIACALALKDIINAGDGDASYSKGELQSEFLPLLSDLYASGIRLDGEL